MEQPRRTNPKLHGNKRKYISRVQRLEMAAAYAYLESMHYDMRLMRKAEKRHNLMLEILRGVHEKNGCKDYVR
jgi:hypothetical protein